MPISDHGWEGARDWQYGRVYWLALASEPPLADEPPPGDGWILNTAMDGGGRTTVAPAWSNGSIVLCRTYWRRPFPGMPTGAYRPNGYVKVDRRPWWNGSNIPAQIRAMADEFGPQAARV
jgi:hypothetical protein